METLDRIRTGLVRITEWLIVVLAAGFTLIVIYAVMSRYLLGFSITWIEEIVRFLLVWIVFLGISVALYSRGHMAMEAIFHVLRPPVQKTVRIAFDLLILVFLIVVADGGARLTISALPQISPVSGISYFWPYLSLPVGATLGAIQAIFLLIEDIRRPGTRNWAPA